METIYIPNDMVCVRTGKQLERLRAVLGVSHAGLAVILQTHERTVRKYQVRQEDLPDRIVEACGHVIRCCRAVQTSPDSLSAATRHRYQCILEQTKQAKRGAAVRVRRQRAREEQHSRRRARAEAAQTRKDLLAAQRAALQAYRHEGDRRQETIRHPHASAPSLDELFS